MSQQAPETESMHYNFSIVGCQKAGTTTLSEALDRHRLIRRSPRKEVHFFDEESYDWSAPDFERDYSVVRRKPTHRALGDATPSYIFWPNALARMAAYNPDMRLIALFRDPLERLFSHWVMVRHRGTQAPDWPEFIQLYRTKELPTELPDDATRYRRFAGVPRGLYGQQLRRGLEHFDREQWLLLEFRSMLSEFNYTLNQTALHLGLHRFTEPPPLENHYPGAELSPGTAPTGDDLKGLADFYAEDLAEFTALSGLDVAHWPTAQIIAGTLRAEDLAAKFAKRVTGDLTVVTDVRLNPRSAASEPAAEPSA